MIRKSLFLFYILLFFALGAVAQSDFLAPFAFKHYLSGNFGELRSNHFHAGLDFKTQGVSGKPIRVVADGYICRAKVQYGGYGRALYVVHDNGYMTVYGHLDAFPENIDKAVRARQYGDESFPVDIYFDADSFRVKRGEVLARAGNAGYSFGPHLHFEVRSPDGEELYNPLLFYKSLLDDTKAPVAQAVAFYPAAGQGVVGGVAKSVVRQVAQGTVGDTLDVWGKIGFGIKARDYMDGTHNKYGVYEIELFVDDSLRFASRMDNVSFTENRLINAWADYERYTKGEGWFLRSFLLDNNPLRALEADAARGWVDVCEERLYKVEYRLRDYHGNVGRCFFAVRGVRAAIPQARPAEGGNYLYWFMNNRIEGDGFSVGIEKGTLFENALLKIETDTSSQAPVYDFGGAAYPLWRNAELSLRIPDALLPFAERCYVKRLVGKGSSAGGKVADGWITASVGLLDRYTVAVDTVAPVLKPVNAATWARDGRVVCSLADKESGLASYKCYIDGRFVLFEYCSKDGRLVCDFKREKISRGGHALRIVATDNVGNTVEFKRNIKY